jgi:large subunit ribosomal protein L4
LPKKVRFFALRSALSAKLAEGKLIIIDDLKLSVHKTKQFHKLLEEKKWIDAKGVLLVDGDQVDKNLKLASSGIWKVQTLPQIQLNVYSILHKEYLVITKSAVEKIEQRLLTPFQPIPSAVQPTQQ